MSKRDVSKSNKTLPSIAIQSIPVAAVAQSGPTLLAAITAAVLTAKKGVAQLFWKIIENKII